MWSSLAAVLGAIALAGCQPSLETVVQVTPAEGGNHLLVLTKPSWKLPDDPDIGSDQVLAGRNAASLCDGAYRVELAERRAGMRCDFNCVEGQPAFESSTIWRVSCEDTAQ